MKTFHIKLTAEFNLRSDADARCDLQHDLINYIEKVIKNAENMDDIWEKLGLDLEFK